MNIGHIPPNKGRVEGRAPSTGTVDESAKRAARLATEDAVVISGPAREQHREVSRLLAKLDSIDTSKSDAELGRLEARLDRGGFDQEAALHKAAARFVDGDAEG